MILYKVMPDVLKTKTAREMVRPMKNDESRRNDS